MQKKIQELEEEKKDLERQVSQIAKHPRFNVIIWL